LAAGLLAAAFVGTAATATRLAPPRGHVAGFPQSTTVSIPAGGDAMISSSTLPPQTKQATINIAPVAGESPDGLKQLATVLATEPVRSKRVLTCVVLYEVLRQVPDFSVDDDFSDPVLGLLLLHACVEIALTINANPATGALASLASACSRTDKAVPLKLRHTGGPYQAHLHGSTRKPSARA
jgi:hypothetical protein